MPISFQEIKARFEAEQRAPIVPRTASDMPPTYESITPAWLTDVLGQSVPGAEVVSHELGPRDDGKGFGIDVALAISIPGLDRTKAEDLVQQAHIVCPYSEATRGNLNVRLSVV